MKTKMSIIILFILNVAITSTLFASGNGHVHQAAGHFKPASLIEPLGVLTFLCLISTFILGQLMPKNRKTLFPWHKRMAVITLIVALTHVSMVLLFH
jgi:membrane-bound acyltransferase YfiQ involved in biofilm formation